MVVHDFSSEITTEQTVYMMAEVVCAFITLMLTMHQTFRTYQHYRKDRKSALFYCYLLMILQCTVLIIQVALPEELGPPALKQILLSLTSACILSAHAVLLYVWGGIVFMQELRPNLAKYLRIYTTLYVIALLPLMVVVYYFQGDWEIVALFGLVHTLAGYIWIGRKLAKLIGHSTAQNTEFDLHIMKTVKRLSICIFVLGICAICLFGALYVLIVTCQVFFPHFTGLSSLILIATQLLAALLLLYGLNRFACFAQQNHALRHSTSGSSVHSSARNSIVIPPIQVERTLQNKEDILTRVEIEILGSAQCSKSTTSSPSQRKTRSGFVQSELSRIDTDTDMQLTESNAGDANA